jgi:hypothetical protein
MVGMTHMRSKIKLCTECECEFDSSSKRTGYANICFDCDTPERVRKSMGVMIADGKTDYHFQIVHNPSAKEAAAIRSAGLAHDPRTQLRAINKVSS